VKELQNYIDSLFQDVPEPKHVPTAKQEAKIKLEAYTPERKIKRVYRGSK
tara:strand:- start:1861 stop:2010 length:150 start_codon:yes stop_codon:yes gene_type:complete